LVTSKISHDETLAYNTYKKRFLALVNFKTIFNFKIIGSAVSLKYVQASHYCMVSIKKVLNTKN